MEFDTYWKNLIDRVFKQRETLRGAEELVYRLTAIYGETMVDGIEAYFERRYAEYEKDIAVLIDNGFADIAADFEEARRVLFGALPLTEDVINPVLDRLLGEGRSEQINVIYDRLIDRLPELLNRRDEIGVANGLFNAEGG